MTRPIVPLSPRQRQVAEMVAHGHTNKAIAKALGLRYRTVRQIVERVGAVIPGQPSARHKIIRWWWQSGGGFA